MAAAKTSTVEGFFRVARDLRGSQETSPRCNGRDRNTGMCLCDFAKCDREIESDDCSRAKPPRRQDATHWERKTVLLPVAPGCHDTYMPVGSGREVCLRDGEPCDWPGEKSECPRAQECSR